MFVFVILFPPCPTRHLCNTGKGALWAGASLLRYSDLEPGAVEAYIGEVRTLCRAYADMLALPPHSIELDFQGFEDELRDLPGKVGASVLQALHLKHGLLLILGLRGWWCVCVCVCVCVRARAIAGALLMLATANHIWAVCAGQERGALSGAAQRGSGTRWQRRKVGGIVSGVGCAFGVSSWQMLAILQSVSGNRRGI